MKKLLMMSVAAFVFASPVAFADHHGDKGDHDKGKMFESADKNGDGSISKDEFKSHHEEKVEEWFGKLDKDGNGEITKEEAAEGRKQMHERMKEKREEMKERMEKRREEAGKDEAAE